MIEETKKNNIKFWINLSVAILALICFFVIEFFVVHFASLKIDEIFYFIFHDNIESNFMTNFYKVFTYIGSFYGLIVISLILLIALKNKRLGILTIVNLIVVGVFNFVIKIIVRRPRPYGINIITESGFSFPSGHAMMSIAFFGLLIYFAYKFIKNKGMKIFFVILFIVIIFMLGVSRIYLGVHYFSDVLAGFLMGYVILSFDIFLFNRLDNCKFKTLNKQNSNKL